MPISSPARWNAGGDRPRGLRIGSTTGYTRPIMEELVPIAAAAATRRTSRSAPATCRGPAQPADDVARDGALGVWPAETVVKVDDTPPGIGEGRRHLDRGSR